VILAVLLGPDLFLAIPWSVRWGVGKALLIAIVALAIWRSPPRPWVLHPPDRSVGHVAAALALQAVTLSFVLPLFSHPGYFPERDWDLHMQWYEAIRVSVLHWRQFPWWNPWCCGGFPLAADPQVGLVSIDTPLVLAFGTPVGLRLAAVTYFMLATEGARRLARLWLPSPFAVAAAAAVYGWNGAIIHYAVSGHALTMSYPFLPWMLVYAFRIDRGPGMAVALGVAAAFSVLTIIQYPTAYALLITLAVLFWGFLGQPRGGRVRYLLHLGLAGGVFLALAGGRMVLTGLVVTDFPRDLMTPFDNTPWEVLRALLSRGVTPPRISVGSNFVPEASCYVGAVPVLAMLASLRRGWQWWHTLAFICFALSMGQYHWYQPSSLIRNWPVFKAMYMVGRWRIPGVLGLALAAGDELQYWLSRTRLAQSAAAALAVLVVLDLAVYAHQCLPTTFNVPPEEILNPGPPTPRVINLEYFEANAMTQACESTALGYGVIRGYCPLLGYDRVRRETARLWRGHPQYVGEFWSGSTALEPVSWSPNRVVLRAQPGQEVECNMNPGSWWRVNGQPVSAAQRCAEPTERFVARADEQGFIRLEVHPRGLGAAAAATAAGVLLAACFGTAASRLRARGRATIAAT
jgi:hypothetical protein